MEEFTGLLTTVDTQIPPLPPKDVIQRIYRDVSSSGLYSCGPVDFIYVHRSDFPMTRPHTRPVCLPAFHVVGERAYLQDVRSSSLSRSFRLLTCSLLQTLCSFSFRGLQVGDAHKYLFWGP